MEPFLKAKQVAALFGVSQIWILKLAAKGEIPFYRLGEGKALRFAPEELRQWLETKKNQPSRMERRLRPKGAGRKRKDCVSNPAPLPSYPSVEGT